MTTLIIVPMKDPARSKTRLSTVLDARERVDLARCLFCRGLTVLQEAQTQTDFDLAVVTASTEVRALAGDAGVPVITEVPGETLSAAIEQAATWATEHGYQRLGVIPADLAAPNPGDVARLLAAAAPVVVCPSLYGGTNALLVAPPRAIPFCYGPHSAWRHIEAAETLGLPALTLPLDSFRLDIDTSSCLARALRGEPSLAAGVMP